MEFYGNFLLVDFIDIVAGDRDDFSFGPLLTFMLQIALENVNGHASVERLAPINFIIVKVLHRNATCDWVLAIDFRCFSFFSTNIFLLECMFVELLQRVQDWLNCTSKLRARLSFLF